MVHLTVNILYTLEPQKIICALALVGVLVLPHMDKMTLLTGSSDALLERCKERREQVLLGKAWPLLRHKEYRPGGHTLKLLGCQLVFEVQEINYL